ncbi:MAG: hypothetical protein ACKO2D_12610, partial [Chloroflexota bacterium]
QGPQADRAPPGQVPADQVPVVPVVLVLRVPVVLVLLVLRVPVVPVLVGRAPLVSVDRVRAAVRVLAGPPKVVHDPAATRNRRRRAHRNLPIPLKSGNGRGSLLPSPDPP